MLGVDGMCDFHAIGLGIYFRDFAAIGSISKRSGRGYICVVIGTSENGTSRMDTNLDVDSKDSGF